MKTLYIVRHAKSSWDNPGLEDHQRPLLEKGKKRTRYVIDYLLNEKTEVDLIVSSHAVRAYETARIIANALQYPTDRIMISKNLYFGDPESFFDIFYDLSDEINSLMLVGHNPGFTTFANYFLDKRIDNLPTSGIVSISFEMNNWENIHDSKRKTKFVVSPRQLRQLKRRNHN
jgi:phosphohistidine phosphatase